MTTTLKYFEIPHKNYGATTGTIYYPEDLTEKVNIFAYKNSLEIVSISAYTNNKDKGLYVVFKEKK